MQLLGILAWNAGKVLKWSKVWKMAGYPFFPRFSKDLTPIKKWDLCSHGKKRDEIIFQKEQEKKKSFSQNIFFAERAAFAFKKRRS